jgi:hypothetical protein
VWSKGRIEGCTYGNGGGLSEETDEVESQLAVRRESDAERDHEDYDGQFAVGLLDAGAPGDKEDGNGGKCLDDHSRDWEMKRSAKMNFKKGVRTLSIWM